MEELLTPCHTVVMGKTNPLSRHDDSGALPPYVLAYVSNELAYIAPD